MKNDPSIPPDKLQKTYERVMESVKDLAIDQQIASIPATLLLMLEAIRIVIYMETRQNTLPNHFDLNINFNNGKVTAYYSKASSIINNIYEQN